MEYLTRLYDGYSIIGTIATIVTFVGFMVIGLKKILPDRNRGPHRYPKQMQTAEAKTHRSDERKDGLVWIVIGLACVVFFTLYLVGELVSIGVINTDELNR